MHISPCTGSDSARASLTKASGINPAAHPPFCGSSAGVHLDKNRSGQVPALIGPAPRQSRRQLGPVERVDGVEHLDRGPRLVGLQRPDQVQLDPVIARLEIGPAALRLSATRVFRP